MKVSLYVSLITLAVVSSVPSASAQNATGRGARFDFAPNVWHSESVTHGRAPLTLPDPAHVVRAGAMPSGDALGLDPSMLAKPQPQPVVTTSLTPSISVPKANYNASFGKPAMPQLAMAKSAPAAMPMSAPAQAVHKHVNKAVAGRMLSQPHVKPMSATPVASYGNQFYTPGSYLPGASSSTSADVYGRLINSGKRAHH